MDRECSQRYLKSSMCAQQLTDDEAGPGVSDGVGYARAARRGREVMAAGVGEDGRNC